MQLTHTAQRGMMLLEALLGVLIFSIGIIAMMGLQASSLANVNESKYRSEAAFLGNKLITTMNSDVAVARNNNLNFPSSPYTALMNFPVNNTTYTYDLGSTNQSTTFMTALIPTKLQPWLALVQGALPQVSPANDTYPTVLLTPCVKGTAEPKCPTSRINDTNGKTYGQVVEITVRWKLPNSTNIRQHKTSTYFAYDDLDQ